MANPNPQPPPLDLAQFAGDTLNTERRRALQALEDERFNTDGQLDDLVAEVQRQRSEIERLRAALVSLLDCSALNEDDNEDSLPAIEAARAALGDR